MLEKPIVEYADYSTIPEHLSYQQQIRQLSLKKESLKYVINPASGLKVKEIDAAIQLDYNENIRSYTGFFNSALETPFPKPVEFGPTGSQEPLQKRYNDENIKMAFYDPLNAEQTILRTNFVPLSCFHKLSIEHHIPEDKFEVSKIPGLNIEVKLKIKLKRKDGNGQNVLLVRTYDGKMKNVSGDIDLGYFVERPVTGQTYPTDLTINGNKSAGLLPNAFEGLKTELTFKNQTIDEDKAAFDKIFLKEGVSFNNNPTVTAGEEIVINNNNAFNNPVTFKIEEPIPSCKDPVDVRQATVEDVQNFCEYNSTYNDKKVLEKKSPENELIEKHNKNKQLRVDLTPNPVQKTLRLGFKLPESSHVRIQIKGVSGKMVKTNVANRTFSKGTHKVSINTANFSAGFYICTIQTRFGRETLKFVKQ